MDIEVKMPDIGLDEVEVIEILVQVNEKIELEQGLITVEGEKASMEIPSPVSGIVKNIYIKVGDKIKSSFLIMMCSVHDFNSENKRNILEKKDNSSEQSIIENKKQSSRHNFAHATPVIRRLVRDLNINLCDITGTGRKNRIVKEDVELYINNFRTNFSEKKHLVNSNNFYKLEKEEVELNNLQKITGKNLHQNWINIPHVTQFEEVDITVLEKFRKKYNDEKRNKNNTYNNITILSFILKVVACALERFPIFNSSLSSDNQNIIFKKYINIGIAVDTDNGLLVPVIKDVDKKKIEALSLELILISEKARQRKLNKLDMSNGCFTISNLGGLGGSWFTPIINAPEVAILGVSKSRIKPLWNEKQFIPALILPLSLSYDHRVINGADAARFITFISKLLSDIHFLVM